MLQILSNRGKGGSEGGINRDKGTDLISQERSSNSSNDMSGGNHHRWRGRKGTKNFCKTKM